MSNATIERPGRTATWSPGTPQRLARLAGWLYLSLVGLGLLGPVVLDALLVPGDAAATAENVTGARGLFTASLYAWVAIVTVDTALAVVLYALLAPVDRVHSMVAAAFRLVYSAALGAMLVHAFHAYGLLFSADTAAGRGPGEVQDLALDQLVTFHAGFLVALVVFGAHLVALGTLFLRSGCVPRVISVLLVAAGVGYVGDSFAALLGDGAPTMVSVVLLAPAILGELALTGWLLVKGVQVGAPRTG